MEKQTAGRDGLGDFAPKFAELNDEALFGEVRSREEELSPKTRSIVTVAALVGKGFTDSSLNYHLETARQNGVSKDEMAEMFTHLAFYAGWPNAWVVLRQAQEVYAKDENQEAYEERGKYKEHEKHDGFFGQGEPNEAFARYFVGQSYLKPLTGPDVDVRISNVTFEPGCRNNWHIQCAASGSGQILFCVDGEGWYQEEGRPARSLKPGNVVCIPAGAKHWHGAKAGSWFSHLAMECPGEDCSTERLEPVSDEDYAKLEEGKR